jgi:hypothetical protein
VQKTYGENWSLEVGYLGSKLTNLGVPDVNLNQLGADQLALGSQLTEPVSNPFFGGSCGSWNPALRRQIPISGLRR